MLTDFNNIWREYSWVNLQQAGVFLSLHINNITILLLNVWNYATSMHEYYAQENGKIYYAITSRDARENDATQTSEVSKYQINQPA